MNMKSLNLNFSETFLQNFLKIGSLIVFNVRNNIIEELSAKTV